MAVATAPAKERNLGSKSNLRLRPLEDRVVVTAENLSEPFATNRNSFQIEVFYDGRIRFTYLQLDARGGIVGLSRGLGIPPGFVESDFTAYPQCQPPLTLIAPTNLAEHSGSITGSVGRPFPDPTDVVVTLASSDSSEIMVPASVVISAGQTNATFAMTVLDDGKLDGTQAASTLIAVDKARSAARFKRPTKALQDTLAGGGDGLRMLALQGAVPVEGGVPLLMDGKIVGAIGLSGGTSQQDGQCAAAGAATLK